MHVIEREGVAVSEGVGLGDGVVVAEAVCDWVPDDVPVCDRVANPVALWVWVPEAVEDRVTA